MINFYVYYHEKDGTIVSVTPVKDDSDLPFVTIDEAAGSVFMSGECSIRNYYVDPELEDTGFPLLKRKVKTVSIETTTDFDAIDESLDTENCITVFPNAVSISFDQQDSNITEILMEVAETNSTFPIFLTMYNNPDAFLEEIDVSMRKLLSMGTLDIPRKCTTTDVSAFSNYIMKMFRLEKCDESKSI